MTKDKTFMKITNKEIYSEICEIKKIVEINHGLSTKEFQLIKHRLDQTNGRVKLNKWIATTALTMCMALVGALLGTQIL